MALTSVLEQCVETPALGLVALVIARTVLPHSSFLAGWFTNPIEFGFELGIAIYAAWSRGWFQRMKPLWLAGGVLGVLALVGALVDAGMARVARSVGVDVVGVGPDWYRAVAEYGVSALFDPAEVEHQNLLGHRLSHDRAISRWFSLSAWSMQVGPREFDLE